MTTVARFLLHRLREIGCEHIFGVPGDFVLGFFNQILASEEVEYVGTCNELNAAYAADGYARIKGVGCVSTTYSVGELSALNGVAGSYAERVPVIKITGVPATKSFEERPLLHHSLGDYWAAYKCYSNVTVAQVLLTSPENAVRDIDNILQACLLHSAPVYIGLPTDLVDAKITTPIPKFAFPTPTPSDPCALEEAVLEALKMFRMSRRPLFIPGVEIDRQNLKKEFVELVSEAKAPFSTMMLSKAMIDETHPQYIGLYCGDRSRPYVRKRVEESDCLFILGERLTDFNTGGFSASLDKRNTIECFKDSVRIMFHVYHDVFIGDFIRELTSRLAAGTTLKSIGAPDMIPATQGCVHRKHEGESLSFNNSDTPLTMSRLFDRMAYYIKPNAVVIAETGASLFSAAEVLLPHGAKFIGQTFYGSIGYTVGATLGVCIAAPERPVYLFIGDGSFQVTAQDLSTMLRYHCRPTIFLLNNDGYTIERVIVDRPYNDIQPWQYHKIAEIFSSDDSRSVSHDCYTESELETALADDADDTLKFIEVHLERWDCNESLRRAGVGMALANGLLEGEELEKAKKYKKDASLSCENFYASVVRKPSCH